jgi:hypothetical protein
MTRTSLPHAHAAGYGEPQITQINTNYIRHGKRSARQPAQSPRRGDCSSFFMNSRKVKGRAKHNKNEYEKNRHYC